MAQNLIIYCNIINKITRCVFYLITAIRAKKNGRNSFRTIIYREKAIINVRKYIMMQHKKKHNKNQVAQQTKKQLRKVWFFLREQLVTDGYMYIYRMWGPRTSMETKHKVQPQLLKTSLWTQTTFLNKKQYVAICEVLLLLLLLFQKELKSGVFLSKLFRSIQNIPVPEDD